jgi:signal transduction histidine kinase
MVFFVEQQTDQMEQMENGLRQKNAQLERMISILAHEIRNPLGSIKAGLDYLEPAFSHDESILQDLNTIQGEIRRMDRLLEDALVVSRPSELKTRPQSITDLLDHLLAGKAKLLEERGVAVRKKYEPDLPRIPLDRVQMEQVFDNLIINAMHAMTGGGHLTVTAAVIVAPSSDSSDSRPVLQVEVGDSGPGIPPEKLERIFDPFFTTKKGGTGLGLAVARRIVGQHNGTLKANSWPGIGTIFVITLPVEDEPLE